MSIESWKEVSLKLLDSKKVDKPIIGIIILLILIVFVVFYVPISKEVLILLIGVLIIVAMIIFHLTFRENKDDTKND